MVRNVFMRMVPAHAVSQHWKHSADAERTLSTAKANSKQLVLTSGKKLVNNDMVKKILMERDSANREKLRKKSLKKKAVKSVFDPEDSENSVLVDPDEEEEGRQLRVRTKQTPIPSQFQACKQKLTDRTNTSPGVAAKRGRGRPKNVK